MANKRIDRCKNIKIKMIEKRLKIIELILIRNEKAHAE